MSEDETECRLTFEEGRRIRREAENPYYRKFILCMILGFAFTTFFMLMADIKYDVLWEGSKAIEDRIIAGDFQAIVDYFNYRSMRSVGPTGGILFVLCGAGYAVLGLLAGKKALKEANEKKVERCQRREGRLNTRRSSSTSKNSATNLTKLPPRTDGPATPSGWIL